MDNEWIKPGVKAMVEIAEVDTSIMGLRVQFRIDGGSTTVLVPAPCIRPLPTPSPTAQRVVEAAMAERLAEIECTKTDSVRVAATAARARRERQDATDAHLATLAPPNPLAELIAAGEARTKAALAHLEAMGNRNIACSQLSSREILNTTAAELTRAADVRMAADERWNAAIERAIAGEKG